VRGNKNEKETRSVRNSDRGASSDGIVGIVFDILDMKAATNVAVVSVRLHGDISAGTV